MRIDRIAGYRTKLAVLAAVVTLGGSLIACTHSSGQPSAKRRAAQSAAAAAATATADRAAQTYAAAVSSWATATAATVHGLDFARQMVVAREETTAQQRAEATTCAKAKSAQTAVSAAPQLAAAPAAGSTAYAAAQRTQTTVRGDLATLSGQVSQYVDFCDRYDAGLTAAKKFDASYTAWIKKYNYTKRIVIGTTVSTCTNASGNVCLRPEPQHYAASAAAYGHAQDYFLDEIHALGATSAFPGAGWATTWRLANTQLMSNYTANRTYQAALKSYQGKSNAAVESKNSGINKAAVASRTKSAAEDKAVLAGIKASGGFPASLYAGYAKAAKGQQGAELTYFAKYQMGQLETSMSALLAHVTSVTH